MKIVINNQIIEKVAHVKYLGCDITSGEYKDIYNKVNIYQIICEIVRKTLKETQIKSYKVVAVPSLLYGSNHGHQAEKISNNYNHQR